MNIKTISNEEFIISDVINGYYREHHYFYYSKEEATKMFKTRFEDEYILEQQ